MINLLQNRRRGRSKRSAVDAFLEAIKGKSEEKEEAEEKEKEEAEARAGKVVRMDLRLTGRQTRHRKKVVRIQPATTYMQHDVEYKVWV